MCADSNPQTAHADLIANPSPNHPHRPLTAWPCARRLRMVVFASPGPCARGEGRSYEHVQLNRPPQTPPPMAVAQNRHRQNPQTRSPGTVCPEHFAALTPITGTRPVAREVRPARGVQAQGHARRGDGRWVGASLVCDFGGQIVGSRWRRCVPIRSHKPPTPISSPTPHQTTHTAH
jgi:hypothetical protein